MRPAKLGHWCPGAPKHLRLAMASRRAAFSGNTSLIATFSSLRYVSAKRRNSWGIACFYRRSCVRVYVSTCVLRNQENTTDQK